MADGLAHERIGSLEVTVRIGPILTQQWLISGSLGDFRSFFDQKFDTTVTSDSIRVPASRF